MRPWPTEGLLVAPATVLLLALIPTVGAAPPADAFCVILIEPSEDFSKIRVSVDEETTLEERAALWPSVDLDQNGVVSPVEKDAFRWSETRAYANQSELGVNAVVLRPDAPYTKASVQRPVYATAWRQIGHVFHKQNYDVPDRITETTDLETQEVREFGFELEADRSSRFILSGGRNLTEYGNLSAAPSYRELGKPKIEYVVVRAPNDWIVQRVEGFSYNGSFAVEPGTREVDVPAFDTKLPYNITFLNPDLEEKLSDIGTPGPELAGLLLVFSLAAVRVRLRGNRAEG